MPAVGADHDPDALLARQKTLNQQIQALRREQDFLLFQKTVSEQDSKYVIITLAGKTGQLKYKSRVLKDISVLSQSKHLERLSQGALPLTEKIEGPSKKRALIFGNSLLMIKKGTDPAPRSKLPRLVLSSRDFRAVFASLETGAFLYVVVP